MDCAQRSITAGAAARGRNDACGLGLVERRETCVPTIAMTVRRKVHRPRDAFATREVLLEAATRVFAERGFAGARVDEIAARAGVNKALIYAYYRDKKGIYRALFASRLRELGELAGGISVSASPRRSLEDLIRQLFRMLIQDRPFARLLVWDLLAQGPEGRELIWESSRPLMDLIFELVRRGRDAGELSPSADPELFRSALVALGLGYTVQQSIMALAREQTGVARTDEQFVNHACRMLLEVPGPGDADLRSSGAAGPRGREVTGRTGASARSSRASSA